MYDLPDDFNQHLLAGCYLSEVCFGPATTKLEFSRPRAPGTESYNVTFVVEGKIAFMCDHEIGSRVLDNPLTVAPLIGLLMRDVEALNRRSKNGLQISFMPNGYIVLDADDARFEGYSIYLPSGDIIVV